MVMKWLECVKAAHVNLITLVDKMSHHLSDLITLFFFLHSSQCACPDNKVRRFRRWGLRSATSLYV